MLVKVGSAPTPKHLGYWDIVVKLRNVSKDEVVAALEQIEGQEIADVREV